MEERSYLQQYDDRPTLSREQDEEDYMAAGAWDQVRTEVVKDLQYRAYRWQRSFYGIEAERLAPHFPCADKFERAYQEELARRTA